MTDKPKYAQSSAVYFNYTLEYAIRDLARLGYDGVEIWGGRPHFYRDDLADAIPRLKDLARELGMEICNFIPAQFRYPSLLCSLDEGIRKDSVGYVATAMKNAAALGVPSVSLCPGMVPWDQDLEAGRKNLMKSFRELASINGEYGRKLLIEPAHRFETNLILTIDDCIEAMDQLDSDAFGILLDVGHCHVNGEDLPEAVRNASAYPLHIHLDDNRGDMDAHLIPGEGTIDFGALATVLEEIDYRGFISVEIGGGYIMDPAAACKTSLERLRNHFG